MASLMLSSGRQPGRKIDLPAAVSGWVLGRSSACDITLDDEKASRRHLQIDRDGLRFVVEDLKSTNGTLINGQPLTSRRVLNHGDQLQVGDLVLRFDDGSGPLPTVAIQGIPFLEDSNRPISSTISFSLSSEGKVSQPSRPVVAAETKLHALRQISHDLRRMIDATEIFPAILDSLLAIFPSADRGFLLLVDDKSGEPELRAMRFRKDRDTKRSLSRTIIRTALEKREAILSNDVPGDDQFKGSASVIFAGISSVMCVPLLASSGAPLGALEIDSLSPVTRFSPDDLELLATVAELAAIAVENARLHDAALAEQQLRRDIEVAQVVQRSFLPQTRPEIPGYAFFDFYQAARDIGGDYYDYIALPDGRIVVVLGDVSGKGVAAALQMSRVCAEARFHLASTDDIGEAISRLNDILCKVMIENRFVTFAALALDPRTNRLAVVNAGHIPPLLCRKGAAAPIELAREEAGFPLGWFAGMPYQKVEVELQPGDAVVVFTDGVTEALNPAMEMFDSSATPRVRDTLLSLGGANPQTIGTALVDSVKAWIAGGAQSDDICLVSFGLDAAGGAP